VASIWKEYPNLLKSVKRFSIVVFLSRMIYKNLHWLQFLLQ